jgi:ABC-type lipoprotein export system ATPase subunit
MHTTARLTLTNIHKAYDRPILVDISLTVEPGEALAIIGPSGSGKSTLLNIIGSLDAPTSGSVRLGEVEVTALSGEALTAFRASAVGFVFQDHHLLPQLTALENVLLPTLAAGKSEGAVAGDLLQRVGVAQRGEAFPTQMSGGERQRVAVARALINSPRLLLCDEPTGNLDQESGAAIISLLLELARQQGVTVLMVTHNLAHAARFDRCLQLREGQLLEEKS